MHVVFLSLTIWQRLEEFDKQLFLKLNGEWTNPVFDFILPYFRDSVFWAPLYIFMMVFVILNYGKKGWLWALAFVCTVAIADMIGAQVIKESFKRSRPCNDLFIMDHVRLLVKKCGSGFSFTSNHAANHFGIATFVSLTFYPTFKRWIHLFYLWAFFVSYAQVYVGVHYPFDILGGAVLGILAGVLTASIFNKKAGSFTLAT